MFFDKLYIIFNIKKYQLQWLNAKFQVYIDYFQQNKYF